jgi:hypothetical protein
VNKVLLTGRLTRDPEMRSLASGKAVTQFSVATNEYIGQGKEKAEYHNIVTCDCCDVRRTGFRDSAPGLVLALGGMYLDVREAPHHVLLPEVGGRFRLLRGWVLHGLGRGLLNGRSNLGCSGRLRLVVGHF